MQHCYARTSRGIATWNNLWFNIDVENPPLSMMFLRMDLDFHIYLIHQKVHPAFFPTLVERIAWV